MQNLSARVALPSLYSIHFQKKKEKRTFQSCANGNSIWGVQFFFSTEIA